MNDKYAKNVLKNLTPQERVVLADLWESDARGALTKLLGTRQLQLAQQTLKSSGDHYHTVENRGRANECENIADLLSRNLKEQNDKRETKSSN